MVVVGNVVSAYAVGRADGLPRRAVSVLIRLTGRAVPLVDAYDLQWLVGQM